MKRYKSDYEIGEDDARRANEAEAREMFLLLFYRERVSRLAQRLRSETDYKAAIRRKHEKDKLKEHDATVPQIAEWLGQFIARAEDETRCNDTIKSIYFCDRKKGHKGNHGEWCGAEPVPKKVGGPGWLVWPQESDK